MFFGFFLFFAFIITLDFFSLYQFFSPYQIKKVEPKHEGGPQVSKHHSRKPQEQLDD
jgi:hypothetical protein